VVLKVADLPAVPQKQCAQPLLCARDMLNKTLCISEVMTSTGNSCALRHRALQAFVPQGLALQPNQCPGLDTHTRMLRTALFNIASRMLRKALFNIVLARDSSPSLIIFDLHVFMESMDVPRRAPDVR
jgi:hypothetical protein